MRVMVTGASGFVGLPSASHLLARGIEVHAVGRTPPALPGLRFHAVDLADRPAMRAVLQAVRPTHLLHLAWDVTPGRYARSPANLDWVRLSLDLLQDFAALGGRRFVGAGTCAEYAWGTERFVENRTPCEPATLYGASKDALRRVVQSYAAATGLSAAWGRIFYLYGPGERPGRLVADAVAALREARPFPTSHGRQRRDFLHVDDVGGALAALLAGTVEGPVNVASGTAVPVRDILDRLASRLGNATCLRYGERPLPASEPPVIEADVSRLRDEVGFRPRFALSEGLDTVVAAA